MDRDTLKLLRKQARIGGKRAPLVAELPDDALEFVYDQIRGGASNRSIARALKAKLQLTGSENSIAQSVAKLRKRTSSLLKPTASSNVWEPVPSIHQADSGNREISQETELETIKKVESSYGALIEAQVAKAQSNGLIPSDLAKHVKALAELSKVRHRLEKASQGDAWPGVKKPEDLEIDRLSNLVLTHVIGDDKEKYIRGAQKFLEAIMNDPNIVDIDPETGEILSVKRT